MTVKYKVEFIINAGMYQHVALWIEGDSIAELERARDELPNEVVQSLALTHTAVESQMKKAWAERLEAASAVVQKELGAEVEETTDNPVKPSWTAPVKATTKPWSKVKEEVAKATAPSKTTVNAVDFGDF